MEKRIILSAILFGLFLILPNPVLSQDGNGANVPEDEIIELSTAEIKVKIETPQVKLYSSRIKPEFDAVHLEKSFKKEITGLGETFEIKAINKNNTVTRIEIDKLLKKVR